MVVVVEEVVIAMALLQRRPAQDTQVQQEAEVEDSPEVVETTATVLLLLLQAPPILHRPVPAQVLTQPQHQVQAPVTDLRQEVAVACLAMEVVAVAALVVVTVEVEESLAPRCRRRAVSKFQSKLQFRWEQDNGFLFYMQMLVSAEYLTNLFGNNLQELKWQLAGATTAVSGSVEAGAERELQPGDKDTDTKTKKTTNAQSQPVSKLKQSVRAIYSVNKEELQTSHKYCAVCFAARSCYPTNQLI